MKKVYQALVPVGLAGVGVGAAARAFRGARDKSLAFGDINDNLLLLTNEDPYLSSITNTVTVPRRGENIRPLTLSKKMQQEIQKEEERDKEGAYIDLESLRHPFRTFFQGSPNPTGNEDLSDIPAFAPLAMLAGLSGLTAGRSMMDRRLKMTASNKVKKEKEKAKREFEAALIYEQEEAAKRNKKASEQCELVQAVDHLYSAAYRYDHLVKTAGGIGKGLIGITGLLAILIGANNFRQKCDKTKSEIKQKEKEKMLGIHSDYSSVLGDLGAKNLAVEPVGGISKYKGPTITTQLVKESAERDDRTKKKNRIAVSDGNEALKYLAYVTGVLSNVASPIITRDSSPYQFADADAVERLVNDLAKVRPQELGDINVETAPSFSGFGRYFMKGLTNKRTTLIGKILSAIGSPIGYTTAHFGRSPSYHALNNTIVAPWNNLGATSHELGHAIDFNKGYVDPKKSRWGNLGSRLKRDAYQLAAPFFPIYPEVKAWESAREAIKDSYKKKKTELTNEDKRKLNRQLAAAQDPALSTYVVGTAGRYVPAANMAMLPAMIGTSLLNPRMEQQQKRVRRSGGS